MAYTRVGEVGAAVFDLKTLRARAVRAARPPGSTQDQAPAELAGREFRFAVPAVPSARLPRDLQSLANIWKSIADPPAQQPDPDWAALMWTALMAPTVCVPLLPREGVGQEFCVVAAVDPPNRTPVLVTVKVSLAPKATRQAQSVVIAALARVVSDPEVMAEHLEELHLRAVPEARSAARRSAARAMWLGGDSATGPVWRDRIEATCAVMGLAVEIIEEPARRLRTIEEALGASAAPTHLLVWRPMCRGVERLIDKYVRTSVGGDVIFLDEPTFADVLLEARLALLDRGLAEPIPPIVGGDARTPPVSGEERFYIKVGGSKAGDALIDAPDCGHARWGGDVRRRAPRALKGVERLEGVRPQALFLCGRCTKHRWRARF